MYVFKVLSPTLRLTSRCDAASYTLCARSSSVYCLCCLLAHRSNVLDLVCGGTTRGELSPVRIVYKEFYVNGHSTV
eukprot:2296024-Rhodomonas_salina.1